MKALTFLKSGSRPNIQTIREEFHPQLSDTRTECFKKEMEELY